MTNGQLIIVGAGPGDPDLLTRKGQYWLEKADVVLVDHLVHTSILTHCKPSVSIINVGKRRGKESTEQSDINKLMVEKVKEGQCVVRLKGGDPFVFGRLGEELAYVTKHEVSVQVVPGVSSAIAAPGMAGIPLTHRNLSRSVAFVTGTLKRDEVHIEIPEADTLVFLMAVAHCDEIVNHVLTLSKFSKDTPAAFISNGTLAKQRIIKGTLETIASLKKDIDFPALLVIGDVVSFSDECQWWATRPLSGKRIVLLREKHRSESLARELSQEGAEVVCLPMIEITPIKETQKQCSQPLINEATMCLFTSVNSVHLFCDSLLENGVDNRALSAIKIGAVGAATSDALKQRGLLADYIPSEYSSAEGLINVLPEDMTTDVIILPIAEKANTVLEDACKERGARVKRLNMYTTTPAKLLEGELYDGDYVVFSSGSTAEYFFKSAYYKKQRIYSIVNGENSRKSVEQFVKDDIIKVSTLEPKKIKEAILMIDE